MNGIRFGLFGLAKPVWFYGAIPIRPAVFQRSFVGVSVFHSGILGVLFRKPSAHYQF